MYYYGLGSIQLAMYVAIASQLNDIVIAMWL